MCAQEATAKEKKKSYQDAVVQVQEARTGLGKSITTQKSESHRALYNGGYKVLYVLSPWFCKDEGEHNIPCCTLCGVYCSARVVRFKYSCLWWLLSLKPCLLNTYALTVPTLFLTPHSCSRSSGHCLSIWCHACHIACPRFAVIAVSEGEPFLFWVERRRDSS